MTDVCIARMEAFGMVGQAGGVPVVSLGQNGAAVRPAVASGQWAVVSSNWLATGVPRSGWPQTEVPP